MQTTQYAYVADQPSAKEVSDYIIYFKDKLGKGKYGTVYEGKRKSDNLKVAVKVSTNQDPMDEKCQREIMNSREIQVMKKVKSENLVAFYDCKITKNNIYIFMEYCNGGNLTEYLKKNPDLSDHRIVEIFQQVSMAFKTLTKENVIHRDLKPDNILLHNGVIKISDFGFARFIEGDPEKAKDYTLKGTPLYVPPQVFDTKKYSNLFDVWSFGCILFEMMYGHHIHDNISGMGQLKTRLLSMKDRKISLPASTRHAGLVQLLSRMLEYQEEDRISWKEIFENDINKLTPEQYLGNYGDVYESPTLAKVKSAGPVSELQSKLSAIIIFNQIIQDLEKGNYPPFTYLKWSNIVLILWLNFIENLLQKIEVEKATLKQKDEKQETTTFEHADEISRYLKELLDKVQQQQNCFFILIEQWLVYPKQMLNEKKGNKDDEDFYAMIRRNDQRQMVSYAENNIQLAALKKEVTLGINTILRIMNPTQ